jgi:hypothetical protein
MPAARGLGRISWVGQVMSCLATSLDGPPHRRRTVCLPRTLMITS